MPFGVSGLCGMGMIRSTLEVKGQGHMRPKIDLEACQRRYSLPPSVIIINLTNLHKVTSGLQ